MILWVNGAFGAGKTTLCDLLVDRIPDAVLFDSERVGYFLSPLLETARPVQNFQDWPAWRTLTVDAIAAVHAELGGTLVVPQSVLVESYWAELSTGIRDRGLTLRAVTLDVDPVELERRIRTDEVETGAVDWRLEHIERYRDARGWLARETELIDATSRTPAELAEAIAPTVR